jgi:competence protein ComEA
MPSVVAVVDEQGRVRRGVGTVVDARLRTMFDGGWVPGASMATPPYAPELPEPELPEPDFLEPELPESDFLEPELRESELPESELPESELPESELPEPGRRIGRRPGLAGIDELIGGGSGSRSAFDLPDPPSVETRRRPRTVWRLDPGRRGAAAIVLVVALTALLVGWRVLAGQPHSRPVAVLPTVSGPATTVVPSTSASARSRPVVVDVVGKVRRPGVVTLPPGSRVVDALRAAGGPLPGTNLASVNLARPVVDGEQIAVGVAGASASVVPAGPSGSTTAGALVDLNTATVAQFDALPGVGPVLAQRIVDWRTMHGAFASVDQLNQVSGIGDAKFADLKALVSV